MTDDKSNDDIQSSKQYNMVTNYYDSNYLNAMILMSLMQNQMDKYDIFFLGGGH